MSLLQQHFEERRECIFNRLKQPEYMERSIEGSVAKFEKTKPIYTLK
ncbi:hypothetical protein BN2127_JRS10_02540 [Bacillus subtilis]|nr:hypothetical protein BN2127_JRS10_02540 [Bacillus subtilis]